LALARLGQGNGRLGRRDTSSSEVKPYNSLGGKKDAGAANSVGVIWGCVAE